MYYTEEEARKLIIKAGLMLTKEKLIARTWGNISARISDDEFIITPSGKAYTSLNETDLVKVKISDLTYVGNIKPSSEKGIHASSYTLRADVNFVVHTHQNFATAISIEGNHPFAPTAKYGLPGTKKLRKNVNDVILKNKEASCFLLERHGALILGTSLDDCFEKANKLEELSKEVYELNHHEISNSKMKPYLDDYAQMFGKRTNPVEDDNEAIELIKYKNSLASSFASKSKPMALFDVWLQHFVYKKKYSKLKDKK